MSRRVLVIEDEPQLRTMIRGALKLFEFEVLEAVTGEQALSMLAEDGGAPDAMMLDLRLPDMDGWEVLRRLRERSQLESLRVVLYTALDGPAVRDQARSYGVAAILPKPCSIHELVKTVSGVIETKDDGSQKKEDEG